MFKFNLDMGTIIIMLLFISFFYATIRFPLSKRNKFFGIKVQKSFESEEIWHKIHVIASLCTIPFLLIFGILIFIEDSFIQLFYGFLATIILIIIYFIIPDVSTKKYFKEKKEKEKKELEEKIKKEQGWR